MSKGIQTIGFTTHVTKLDGVGTIDKRPCWHMTRGMSHVKCDMWPVTNEMWDGIHGGGVTIFPKRQLTSSSGLGKAVFWKGWLADYITKATLSLFKKKSLKITIFNLKYGWFQDQTQVSQVSQVLRLRCIDHYPQLLLRNMIFFVSTFSSSSVSFFIGQGIFLLLIKYTKQRGTLLVVQK